MRVAVTGATGMIGRALVAALEERGDEAVALSRAAAWPTPKETAAPAEALRGTDAVVHLLGEPVDQRWSERAKREIRDSRVLGTRNLVEGIASVPEGERPRVLVSQSASGWYGVRGDEELDESAAGGDDFLAGVVAAWEAEAARAEGLGVRVVRTRTGVVLSPSGGALAKMMPFFKAGVGGPVAGGRQWVPWVHLDDVVGAILFCIDEPRAAGPVNVVAPQAATNRELSKALGRVLRRPAVLPVPAFALRLLYGEMSMIVTTGARLVPARLQSLGYEFRRPDLEDALRAATTR